MSRCSEIFPIEPCSGIERCLSRGSAGVTRREQRAPAPAMTMEIRASTRRSAAAMPVG